MSLHADALSSPLNYGPGPTVNGLAGNGDNKTLKVPAVRVPPTWSPTNDMADDAAPEKKLSVMKLALYTYAIMRCFLIVFFSENSILIYYSQYVEILIHGLN